ncbi:hypothetical protein CCUS01_13326 [Colletotrichum cuscutae]|uniref:Uncharacterized protein n=1 Tax=Colletotrichum cuscutae TaxID=1209917 RepID=A0AAI9YC81_9PEZI|nr:hypothetical protein CCUS01_13326 [Colletotrichum cuscutae]
MRPSGRSTSSISLPGRRCLPLGKSIQPCLSSRLLYLFSIQICSVSVPSVRYIEATQKRSIKVRSVRCMYVWCFEVPTSLGRRQTTDTTYVGSNTRFSLQALQAVKTKPTASSIDQLSFLSFSYPRIGTGIPENLIHCQTAYRIFVIPGLPVLMLSSTVPFISSHRFCGLKDFDNLNTPRRHIYLQLPTMSPSILAFSLASETAAGRNFGEQAFYLTSEQKADPECQIAANGMEISLHCEEIIVTTYMYLQRPPSGSAKSLAGLGDSALQSMGARAALPRVGHGVIARLDEMRSHVEAKQGHVLSGSEQFGLRPCSVSVFLCRRSSCARKFFRMPKKENLNLRDWTLTIWETTENISSEHNTFIVCRHKLKNTCNTFIAAGQLRDTEVVITTSCRSVCLWLHNTPNVHMGAPIVVASHLVLHESCLTCPEPPSSYAGQEQFPAFPTDPSAIPSKTIYLEYPNARSHLLLNHERIRITSIAFDVSARKSASTRIETKTDYLMAQALNLNQPGTR